MGSSCGQLATALYPPPRTASRSKPRSRQFVLRSKIQRPYTHPRRKAHAVENSVSHACPTFQNRCALVDIWPSLYAQPCLNWAAPEPHSAFNCHFIGSVVTLNG
jgi:hypothetical protein